MKPMLVEAERYPDVIEGVCPYCGTINVIKSVEHTPKVSCKHYVKYEMGFRLGTLVDFMKFLNAV